MFIICPKCGCDIYIEAEDLPQSGSDDFDIICDECGHGFKAGWCAELEYR